MLNQRAVLKLVLFIISTILLIWLGAWLSVVYQKSLISELTTQPLADVFNSINALFAGFAFGGVIVTVYLQILEMQDTRDELKRTADANLRTSEANLKMAELSDERAILDLFNVYCSEYFQTVKNSSMSVLIPAVASKAYFDFVVSRLFVAEQQTFPDSDWTKFSQSTYSKSLDDFKSEDQFNRYKLDELMNFFNILTGRQDPQGVIKRCDFSYAWWRPLFWMLASSMKERYQTIETVKNFSTPPIFPDTVVKLDELYGFKPFSSDVEMWEYVKTHPKIKSYGVDELHFNSSK